MNRILRSELDIAPLTGVPEQLIELLRNCLKKSPNDRPASALELVRSLQRVEQDLYFPETEAIIASEPALLPRQLSTSKGPYSKTPEAGGHVFISYVREDSAEVERLAGRLAKAGIQVWRDTQDLWPGQDWRRQIRQAIERGSLAFIACFSDHSASRRASYQNEELFLQLNSYGGGLPIKFGYSLFALATVLFRTSI
jgi:hypothetical protein